MLTGDSLKDKLPEHSNHPKGRNSYAHIFLEIKNKFGCSYKDVPDDCFVRLDWKRNGDVEYVRERLEYAWEHREELSKNARKWYMENCRFIDWESKFKNFI